MAGELELIGRVVLAAVIGGVIGLEREVTGDEPGIRTHVLVSIGAALFTIAGAYGFTDLGREGEYDPARVAAQVATGVGFIGAGAVLRSGPTVRGLTTAATLWVGAAVGVAAGAGIYLPLAAATLLALLVLVVLRAVKPSLMARLGGAHRLVCVEYRRGYGTIGPLIRELQTLPCRVGQLVVEDDDEHCVEAAGLRRVTIGVQVPDPQRLTEVVAALERRDEILSVSVEPVAG